MRKRLRGFTEAIICVIDRPWVAFTRAMALSIMGFLLELVYRLVCAPVCADCRFNLCTMPDFVLKGVLMQCLWRARRLIGEVKGMYIFDNQAFYIDFVWWRLWGQIALGPAPSHKDR